MPQKSKHSKASGAHSKTRTTNKSKNSKNCNFEGPMDDVAEGSREEVEKSLGHQS